MDSLLKQHSILIQRLRRKLPTVQVEELVNFFDNIVAYIKTLTCTNQTNEGLEILTIVSEDLATLHNLQLFDHPALINHLIFVYIGRTLEMLITKSNHSQRIPMKKHEEDCFYSVSYFITQLCLYKNETVQLFYGSISNEILPVTEKVNQRDETIDENSRRSYPLTDKLNKKVSALPPDAPESRPFEESDLNITNISHRKKFPNQVILPSDETINKIQTFSSLPTDLPLKKYQDIFITKSFLTKLVRAIEDLSENDYSSYHIKYKVLNRLVSLCLKLNIVDFLSEPIIKCLCSKFYPFIPIVIEEGQFCLNPKQLFFIYQCPQFIIQCGFQEEKQISKLLCQKMIEVTKTITDVIIPNNDAVVDAIYYFNRMIVRYALRSHLEILNSLSLSSSGRQYFLKSSIIDQMLNILRKGVLIYYDCENEELFFPDSEILGNALMLLCHLAYESEIFSILKQQDLQDIFSKYKPQGDNMIQFALNTLSNILNDDDIDEENEPIKLQKAYIEYSEKNIIGLKQIVKTGVIHRNIRERDDHRRHIPANKTLIEKLIQDLDIFFTTDPTKKATKSLYKSIIYGLRVCTKLDNKDVEILLDPVLKCLNSGIYLEAFEKIELNQIKNASGAMTSNHSLALKHLIFMRECPEFLFRHDYKRYNEIANSLGKKMLECTTTIFEKHVSILIGDQAKNDPEGKRPARMEALSYHIKTLTHFTQTKAMRREFLKTSIIDHILLILKDQFLFDQDGHIADIKLGVIGQSLTLLYNLAYDNEINSILQTANVLDICLELRFSKDKLIHFSSQILSIMLDKKMYNDIIKPTLLCKTCIEYIGKSVKEPKPLYQGIKLNNLLKNITIIIENDTFTDNLIEDKQKGIRAITECVCINLQDDSSLSMIKKIQKLALEIIWKLSSYGPTIVKKLKEDDSFINQLLSLLNDDSEKTKKYVSSIIWRLGTVETVRKAATTDDDDDQLPSTNEWDESIPYDLLMSYSKNINDRILCLKIYNRLTKKGYRIYMEKESQHRLQLTKQAVQKHIPILICLSKNYRSSKICMSEIEYANKQSAPIIPIIIEDKFHIQGWLKHLLGNNNPINFAEKNGFDKALPILCLEIEQLKNED